MLPGCYPDPSICRVGDDYYLVTSTFEHFPGLPIFHSRDLVHWHQIGHAIDWPSSLTSHLGRETFLVAVSWENGWPVFAPAVRHLTTRFLARQQHRDVDVGALIGFDPVARTSGTVSGSASAMPTTTSLSLPGRSRGRTSRGVWLGLYATSNGRPTTNLAQVDWLDYRPA